MTTPAQVVQIGRSATTFTALCTNCAAAFAGRLDADLERGTFLCRAGHAIEIVRDAAPQAPPSAEAAA